MAVAQDGIFSLPLRQLLSQDEEKQVKSRLVEIHIIVELLCYHLPIHLGHNADFLNVNCKSLQVC